MKPILNTKSISPHLKVKGRAIIENLIIHNIGEPIGLLLALTYSEGITLISSVLEEAPLWGSGKSLNSPLWAK